LKAPHWLILLYALPSGRGSLRVGLWRNLKKLGALPLKTSASLLPDTPAHYERFQWLAKQLRDSGGEATLIRTEEIEGLPAAEILTLFNETRATDYAELNRDLTALLRANQRKVAEGFANAAEKLRARGQAANEEQAGKELEYFRKNEHRMHYDDYRSQGLFIGSGVEEAGCRVVIGQRLKKSGMFWSESGATSVLNFRTLLLSHRFDQFWINRANASAARLFASAAGSRPTDTSISTGTGIRDASASTHSYVRAAIAACRAQRAGIPSPAMAGSWRSAA